MERGFKGIWIPKDVWLDTNLSWTEKILFVEIDSLDNKEGCFAGNDYFAKFFGLSKDRISKLVSSLKEKGYITVKLTYKKGTKQIEKRVINIDHRYRRKQLEGIGESNYTPIGGNAKDNNTSFNNTFNNTSNKRLPSKQASTDSEFESLWKLYPNKKGKPVALKAYKKALKNGTTFEEIETGIQNYLAYIQSNRISIGYVKHGSTWFNQQGWLDEYENGKEQRMLGKAAKGESYGGLEF